MAEPRDITIPADLLPADGRFGSGPSKIPVSHLDALAASGTSLMGTSHRQAPVRAMVGRVVEQLTALFDLPDDYRVVLGNGGSTTFWDVATFALVRERSQHLVFGEFGSKFATAAQRAPFLDEPSLVASEPGTRPDPIAQEGVDAYAWAHNETSTAVMAPVRRVPGADPGALMLVDATSAAGGLPLDVREADAYYFAPQKSFASDGGLWIALLSPAALERAGEISASGRWVPASLDLSIAIDNAALDQTYNTPALATLFLLDQQLSWMLGQGGLAAMVERTTASSQVLYGWAERTAYTTPYVAEPADRSLVVGTVDLEKSISAEAVAAVLRANGVVDTEPYRKLGRNQLRIAMFPAIDAADVEALTRCVDHVVERLAG